MKEIRIDNMPFFREQYRKLFTTDFKFNQVVSCISIGEMNGVQTYGRLLQIRRGVGQFGSDMYLIRDPQGRLQVVENELIEPCGLECPIEPGDSETTEYRLQGKWPETGFIIEDPKQPETVGECSLVIDDDGNAVVESENCTLPVN